MRHAVIMAGGPGTRLWPLSRADRPKQLIRLFEGKSLLRTSYERLATLFDPSQIYVITGQPHVASAAEELPELPPENIFGEPCARDTANAVGMASALLHRRDPDGVMGIFTADHIILPVDKFAAALDKAYTLAADHPEALFTFGIKPTQPNTSLGYVQRGESIGDGVYRVQQFKEKPCLKTAQQYVESGQYYWNSGMFVWRTDTIMAQLRQHLADSTEKIDRIADAWNTLQAREVAAELYPTLSKISIDYAIMEKAKPVIVVEMDVDWLDVGSWPSLESVFDPDVDGNVHVLDRVASLDARGNIVVSEEDHLVALIGVEDLIVIHAPDATLICRKGDAQKIKDMVAHLQKHHGDRYQ